MADGSEPIYCWDLELEFLVFDLVPLSFCALFRILSSWPRSMTFLWRSSIFLDWTKSMINRITATMVRKRAGG